MEELLESFVAGQGAEAAGELVLQLRPPHARSPPDPSSRSGSPAWPGPPAPCAWALLSPEALPCQHRHDPLGVHLSVQVSASPRGA